MEFAEAILLTIITASTPLLLAASGELVVERAGVLNLGVEGMMIVGAACGFGGAYLTGSIAVGALCGILGGMALSAIFALLTLGLAANQVASGLALTFIGGESAQIMMKVPLDLTKVFQGILLFYVLACDTLILYRFRLIFAPKVAHGVR